MNSKERFLARIRGEPVDRPPNFDLFTSFAAHYIDQPLSSYYLDYRILAEANLALLEPFQVDIVQVISDPYREAADFGAEVLFPPDALPYCQQPLLGDPGDLLNLKPPDPYTGRRMSDRLMAVRYLKEQVRQEVPVSGWVEGALSQAAILRSASYLLVDFIERAEWVSELLEIAVGVEIQFAKLQAAMGADIIGVSDDLATQISPELYRRFGLTYEQRIFQAIHEVGALGRLHIRGDTTQLLPDMLESGADIIDLDWMVDFAGAARLGVRKAALCGNMDPLSIFLNGDPELVYQDTQRALRQGGERCLNAAGGEILDGTPEENLKAQTRAIGEFKWEIFTND